MERRHNNPHHSTADLLSWSHFRLPDSSSAANRSNQPCDGDCQITKEEAESLNKSVSYRKNCSGHKLKEMVGSDLFSDYGNVVSTRTSRIHYHQDQHSQISFSAQDNPSPKQKELSRTQADSSSMSNCKTKPATGHDIVAPPVTQQQVLTNKNMEEPQPASVKASNAQRVASEEILVKSSKKLQNQRTSNGKLTSNGIFKSDKLPSGYSEKMHSSAKLREMSGHNIFADGKSEYRDYYGGTRRPPGGESSISLV